MRIEHRRQLLLGGVTHRLSPQLRRTPAARLGTTGHEAHTVHLVGHIGDMPAIEAGRLRRTGDRVVRRLGHRLHTGERIGAAARRRIATSRLGKDGEGAIQRHRTVRVRTNLDRFAVRLIKTNRPAVALPARAGRREEQVLAVGRPTWIAAFRTRRRPPLRLAAGRVHHPDLVVPLVLGFDGFGDGHGHPLPVGRHGRTAHVHDAIPVGQHHRARPLGKRGRGWRRLRHHRGGDGEEKGG